MILFSAIELNDRLGAYHWHRGFSGANDALFPRSFDDFETLVMEGSVWAAREAGGDYLALAYSSFDEKEKVCEVGGLMVAAQARGKGLGSMMMRLALIHALLEEDLLSDPEVRVVAHVLSSNPMPRGIIQNVLRFRHAETVEIPAERLPGLAADPDGMIRGDEFHLTMPESVEALADWASSWTGTLPDGDVADIELRSGLTVENWHAALKDLVIRHQVAAANS